MKTKTLQTAIKDILLSKPAKKAEYENKKPTADQLNQKFKLVKK